VQAIVEIGRENVGISISYAAAVGVKGSIVENSHKHRKCIRSQLGSFWVVTKFTSAYYYFV